MSWRELRVRLIAAPQQSHRPEHARHGAQERPGPAQQLRPGPTARAGRAAGRRTCARSSPTRRSGTAPRRRAARRSGGLGPRAGATGSPRETTRNGRPPRRGPARRPAGRRRRRRPRRPAIRVTTPACVVGRPSMSDPGSLARNGHASSSAPSSAPRRSAGLVARRRRLRPPQELDDGEHHEQQRRDDEDGGPGRLSREHERQDGEHHGADAQTADVRAHPAGAPARRPPGRRGCCAAGRPTTGGCGRRSPTGRPGTRPARGRDRARSAPGGRAAGR